MILTNLVGNAFKYSAGKDPVATFLYGEKELEIKITDHGRGIPAKDVPHLFNSFYRGSNVTDIEGTGLGLFIVKNLVAENNAQMIIDSEEEKGTTFTITFNYAARNH